MNDPYHELFQLLLDAPLLEALRDDFYGFLLPLLVSLLVPLLVEGLAVEAHDAFREDFWQEEGGVFALNTPRHVRSALAVEAHRLDRVLCLHAEVKRHFLKHRAGGGEGTLMDEVRWGEGTLMDEVRWREERSGMRPYVLTSPLLSLFVILLCCNF
jgi:hypothetical protein